MKRSFAAEDGADGIRTAFIPTRESPVDERLPELIASLSCRRTTNLAPSVFFSSEAAFQDSLGRRLGGALGKPNKQAAQR
jgi:hypothetical protein